MTFLCRKLYKDFHHQGWNEDDLAKLPAKELVFLCHMAGVAHSGTRAEIIVRLLSLRLVRLELSPFKDEASEVANVFKRDRLRWMCVQANLWKSGSKIQLAAVLLKWRNQCRLDGQKYFQECVAIGLRAGVQMELPI
jgi:hypothetical protein